MRSLLFVRPSGRIEGIYSDDIAPALGRGIKVERAGHVEYDNVEKGWTVSFPDESRVLGTFETRGQALNAEVVEVLRRLRG